MRDKIVFTASVLLAGLLASVSAAPVEITGTLQNANGTSLPGMITVIQEEPSLIFTSYEVEDDGLFQFTTDSSGEFLLHAVSPGHPTAESVIPAGSTGTVNVNFILPIGQDAEVRVVDSYGGAVSGAFVRVRYYEPGKPIRRVAFESDDVTDGDGQYLLQDVGIGVQFVVDVLAPKYAPVSSDVIKLTEGETQIEDINLGEPAATVVVEVRDGKGLFPIADAQVTLLADPSGLDPKDRDSWLHHRAFRQHAVTSKLGNVQFAGVPPGLIVIRVKALTGTGEQSAVAKSNEQTRVTVEVP